MGNAVSYTAPLCRVLTCCIGNAVSYTAPLCRVPTCCIGNAVSYTTPLCRVLTCCMGNAVSYTAPLCRVLTCCIGNAVNYSEPLWLTVWQDLPAVWGPQEFNYHALFERNYRSYLLAIQIKLTIITYILIVLHHDNELVSQIYVNYSASRSNWVMLITQLLAVTE